MILSIAELFCLENSEKVFLKGGLEKNLALFMVPVPFKADILAVLTKKPADDLDVVIFEFILCILHIPVLFEGCLCKLLNRFCSS